MKKQLFAFAITALLLAGCGDNTERHETRTETTVTDREAAETDSVQVEIERASEEVDSLLNDL